MISERAKRVGLKELEIFDHFEIDKNLPKYHSENGEAKIEESNNIGKRIGGCGTVTTMGRELAETYARDPKFYGATYCMGCGKHLPVGEFLWDGTNEEVGSLEPVIDIPKVPEEKITEPYIPPVDIKIGQIFTIEGKKYIVALPKTATQLNQCNDHGHIVITLFDMD